MALSKGNCPASAHRRAASISDRSVPEAKGRDARLPKFLPRNIVDLLHANAFSVTFVTVIAQGGGPAQSVLPGQSPVDAVKSWYCEVSRFPFDSANPSIVFDYTGNNCSGDATGHFTQVVWKSTMRMGCATATCLPPATLLSRARYGYANSAR
jgi:hypothetical protein